MHLSHVTCLERPSGQLAPTGFDIIMPVCKRADNALRALWSIAGQENKADLPVHLIMVDDGGNDDLDNVRDWLDKYDVPAWLDIDIVRTDYTSGVYLNSSRAYNEGFLHTHHNYIIKSGADMIWASPTILDAFEVMVDKDRYVFCNLHRVRKEDVEEITPQTLWDAASVFYVSDHNQNYYPWTASLERLLWYDIKIYGSDYRFGGGEDDELISKLKALNVSFVCLCNHFTIHQDHERLPGMDETGHNKDVARRQLDNLNIRIKEGRLERFVKHGA